MRTFVRNSILLLFLIMGGELWGQTTYSASKPIGSYTSCSFSDQNCANVSGANNIYYLGGIIRMAVRSINGDKVKFRVIKCDGSAFVNDGHINVRANICDDPNQSGINYSPQANFSSGDNYVEIEVTFNHTSSSVLVRCAMQSGYGSAPSYLYTDEPIVISATTSQSTCDEPTNLSESNLTSTSVTLNWSANNPSCSIDGYDVRLYQGNSASGSSIANWNNLSSTSVSKTGLSPNTTYTWKVRQDCDCGSLGRSNYVTHTFVTNNINKPNLYPYRPSSWSDKLVVSKVTGTNSDGSNLKTNDNLYLDLAFVNSGSVDINTSFKTRIYVDNVHKVTYTTHSLTSGYYAYAQDYSLGQLSAGSHSIKIVVDYDDDIDENNENDNEYIKTITINNPANPCSSINMINGSGSGYSKTFTGGGSGSWYSSINNPCNKTSSGSEQIYQYTAPITGTYSIQVTAASGYVDYLWKSGSCSSSGWNCIDDIRYTGQYGSMSWTAGTTYYILLDDENNITDTHTFYINAPTVSYYLNLVGNFSLTFDNTGSPIQSVSVNTNLSTYNVSSNNNWISALRVGNTVYVSCQNYLGTSSRSGTITVSGNGVSNKTISVTQSAPIQTVLTPVISPSTTTFTSSVNVSITCGTSGAAIYYTTDGTMPTTSSISYNGSFTLTNSATVRAKAFKSGYNSSSMVMKSFTKISPSFPICALANCREIDITDFVEEKELNYWGSYSSRSYDNSTNIPLGVSFSWREIPDATSYAIFLADENDNLISGFPYEGNTLKVNQAAFIYKIKDQKNIIYQLDHSMTQLQHDEKYNYQVVAYNNSNNIIACSPKSSFTTYNNLYKTGSNVPALAGATKPISYGEPRAAFNNIIAYDNVVSSIDWDKRYHNCTDYIRRYYQSVYGININQLNNWSGGVIAKGLFGNYSAAEYDTRAILYPSLGFSVFDNGSIYPQTGDILSFGRGYGGNDSHVSIVIESTNNQVFVIQQNVTTNSHIRSYTINSSGKILNHGYSECKILRLKNIEPDKGSPNYNEINNNTITTSKPSFVWEGIPNSAYKVYIKKEHPNQTCFESVSGITPFSKEFTTNGISLCDENITLSNGRYLIRIEAKLEDNRGSIWSKRYYFTVNASSNNCQPLNDILASYLGIEELTAYGSVLSNAKVSIKLNNIWQSKGFTNLSGSFIVNEELQELNIWDSIKIDATGYDNMRFEADTNRFRQMRLHIPMFKEQNPPTNKILYPNIKVLGERIVSQNIVQLKVRAGNMIKYQHRNKIGVENYSWLDHLPNDSIISINLPDTGYNDITIRFISLTDTLLMNTGVYYIPGNIQPSVTKNLTISTITGVGANMFIDGDKVARINQSGQIVQLLNSKEKIRFSKIGYVTKTLFIDSLQTTLNIELEPVANSNDSIILTFLPANNYINYWQGNTIKNVSGSSLNCFRLYNEYTSQGLVHSSATFKFTRNANYSNTYQMLSILDQPNYLSLDSVYLLNIKDGLFNKVLPEMFGDSIAYDSSIQKLSHFKLYAQTEELVFMQRQAPIKKTPLLSVHQSESISVALKDLYSDPDSIPNDMSFDTFNDANFEFTILGDSVLIKHKSCSTGNLTFSLKATHDGLEENGQFGIQVIPLSLSLTKTDIACFGDGDGAINSTISSSDTSLYNYTWSNNSTTTNLSSLNGGNYMLTVTDSNNCTVTEQTTINEPADLTATIAPTMVTCNGYNDGQVDLTVNGGTAGYTFLWSNLSAVEDQTNLSAGIYGVVITDVNGCSRLETVTITEPLSLTTTSVVDSGVSCHGFSDGAATATASGGTLPYAYAWSNSATTVAITGVAAGTYTATITDGNGCTQTESIIITEPLSLTTTSVVDSGVSCHGFSDGAATATASGGTLPYTYAWSNSATTAAITGVAAGTYTTTITDANACTQTESIIITEPLSLTTTSVVDSGVSCHGFSDGAATASASGGTLPYTYAWSNSATTAAITGVAAGTYTATITDVNGCSRLETVTITEPLSLTTTSVVDSDVSCHGFSDGAATATASGGTLPYTYAWSNSATTAAITGLTAGTYTTTITDANACTQTESIIITEPLSLTTTSVVDSDVSCHGFSDGAATATASGGTLPYTYAWSNSATTAAITGVAAGTYTATITDVNGCSRLETVTITEPLSLTTTSVVDSDVSCHGFSDGAATATASGGTLPYTYAWSNSATTAAITGLTAGTYTTTITDANACTQTESIIITEPLSLTTTSVVDSDVSCHGFSDGAATATASGGTLPYTYAWSNSATTAAITGLTAGTYTTTITDGNGCTKTESIIITEPLSLTTTSVVDSDVSCHGFSDGAATATASGGTLPYTYAWSNSATTAAITGLVAGTYTTTVTDGNGCVKTKTINITEPAEVMVSYTQSNVDCYNNSTASIDISVVGGVGGYSYLWDNNSSTQDLVNIGTGLYQITVTDANNCVKTEQIVITQPTEILLSTTHVDLDCFGDKDGTIDLTVSGGIREYTYNWSNATTSEDLSNLSGGTYNITVVDGNGCTKTESVTLTEPQELQVTEVISYHGNKGNIDLTISGGTSNYTYFWHDGNTSIDRNNLAAGDYLISIKDANGCMLFKIITVSSYDFSIAPNPSKGEFKLHYQGIEYGEYKSEIFNSSGTLVDQRSIMLDGNNIELYKLNLSVGIYILRIYKIDEPNRPTRIKFVVE